MYRTLAASRSSSIHCTKQGCIYGLLRVTIFQYRSSAFRDTLYCKPRSSTSATSLQPAAESSAKCVQAIQSDDAQGDGDRLLQADSPRDGGTTEDDGGKEAELDAVRLVVLDTVAAEGICMIVSFHSESPYGFRCNIQSAPTVQPAMTEGSEPVLAYPTIPPVAVSAARMNAGPSRPYMSSVSNQIIWDSSFLVPYRRIDSSLCGDICVLCSWHGMSDHQCWNRRELHHVNNLELGGRLSFRYRSVGLSALIGDREYLHL